MTLRQPHREGGQLGFGGAGGSSARTPARTAFFAGLVLLVLAVAGVLLWSWQARHDELPVTIVAATAVELALALAFDRLVLRSGRAAAMVERVLIGSGFLAMFFLLPHALFGDDNLRFADIETLLHQGHLSKDQYSLLMPLVSVPVLSLGNVVESRTWWAGRFNVIVVAVGLLVAARLLRGRVDAQLLRRMTLLLLAASFLTNLMRDYSAEVLTATLVGLGTICIATNRHVVAGWSAVVAGTVNTPAAIAGLIAIALYEVVRTRRLRYIAPVVAAVALVMLESWIRRGGPLVTGYGGDHGFRTIMPYSGRPGFSYPFLLGLAAILFSFGRGLLFFMPGLALWLDGRTRRIVPERRWMTLMLLFTAGLVLVYAKWWAWYGGIGWGPRFFLFAALPASVILAARIQYSGESRRADALTLGALILSAWVGTAGAIADLKTDLGFCGANGFREEQLCWFTPDYSSLWQAVRQFPPLTASTLVVALFCGLVFAYLAAPLVAELVPRSRPRLSVLAGWRI